MATHIGIGFSALPDPAQAAREAAVQAKNHINVSSTHLVIIFSSIGYAVPDTLATIERILQPERIVGCSSTGIILPDKISAQGIGVLAICSDDIYFGQSSLQHIQSKDMRTAGFQLARDLNADYKHSNRHAMIVFSDNALSNSQAFVHGAQEVLGNSIPIIGAMSGYDFISKKTFQYAQQQILTNSAVGILLGGQITTAVGNKHGWKPLGKPRIINKVNGNIIESIDNKPAINIYETYFEQDAKYFKENRLGFLTTSLYPLGIYLEEENGYLLRNVIDILNDGSIVCQSELPEGAEVHLMIGSKDSCKQAAFEAAHEVREGLLGRQARLILIFESMTRNKLLGRNAFQEIQTIKDVLGYSTPMMGMYCAGELAPLRFSNNQKNIHLQNESIVIVALS